MKPMSGYTRIALTLASVTLAVISALALDEEPLLSVFGFIAAALCWFVIDRADKP
jgi:hypothetical protein